MSKILIVGGGASGMFAAISAARNGHEVWLFEQNEKLGKKLYLTGKGRCNFTNVCDMDLLFSSVTSNRKFLYSSFHNCDNQDVIAFFEELGVATKVERGGRVFPVSDHASDITKALEQEMQRLHVKVQLQTRVTDVLEKGGKFYGLKLASQKTIAGDACIIATGGLSYPETGSTGDGYRFAKRLGHHVTPCIPSLVPIQVKEPWVQELEGLSLRNVAIRILDHGQCIHQDFGEMLFTHDGVSGPLILTASSMVGRQLNEHPLELFIDLKPALTEEQLDKRLLREFSENQNKQFKNILGNLLPQKIIPVILFLGDIYPEKPINNITKEERKNLLHLLKAFPLTLKGLGDFQEAVITKGGVATKEVDPGTMESKLVKGIYFAGEVLDVDALTGGFNLQIAWSTGDTAGKSVGKDWEDLLQ